MEKEGETQKMEVEQEADNNNENVTGASIINIITASLGCIFPLLRYQNDMNNGNEGK